MGSTLFTSEKVSAMMSAPRMGTWSSMSRLSAALGLPGILDPAAPVLGGGASSNPPISMGRGRLAFGGGREIAWDSLRPAFPPGRGTPVNTSGGRFEGGGEKQEV